MSARTICLFMFGIAGAFAPLTAQAGTTLFNDQGASAPCIGIGPIGGPVAEVCAEKFEQSGFIRKDQVGSTGMTMGNTANQDGVIVSLRRGSAAMQSGLQAGDIIETINGHAVRQTPGTVAAQAVFGARGQALRLKLRSAGSERDVLLVRGPQAVADAPRSNNPMIGIHPLVDWRGRFVPCMGAGPVGIVAISWCTEHFKPYGFIKVGDLGANGFEIDRARTDGAFVVSVTPGSPAEIAGVRPSDEIVDVDALSLTAHISEAANELMFGKVGDKFHVTVRRGVKTMTFDLTLD